MFLLIYYIRVGYGVGDASPDPAPNLHGFLKHPPPPPHYNNGSGKTRSIRGGANRIRTGRIQIAILRTKSIFFLFVPINMHSCAPLPFLRIMGTKKKVLSSFGIQPPTYGNLITILSIDGSVVRGIIPATVLEFLESKLQVYS